MNVLELLRTGEMNLLIPLVAVNLLIIAPLALFVAKKKNRLMPSVVILCLVPMVNMYALFFLMLMRKLPVTEKA